MLLVLAANPLSGSGGTSREQVVRHLAEAGADVKTLELDELAENLPGDAQRIVVAGGDGSIGAAARVAHDAGLPLAVVPTGTANDFVRALELPLDVRAACELAADPDAGTRHHEVGLVGNHPFVNMAAAGLSAVASSHAEAHKPTLGPLAYAVGALKAGARAAPVHCTVRCDGEQRFAGEAWQLVVGVTGAFGGGSAIGGTRIDDAELDVAIVPRSRRAALVRYAYGMRRGKLTSQRRVAHYRGHVIEVDLPAGQRFNVDGDLREFRPARFTLLTGGVEVVVGQG